MMCEVNWPLVVEALKVVPPLAVAGIVAWIAYQQWVTAKNKLALDLFDKRFVANKRINDLMAHRAKERVDNVTRMLGAYSTPLSDELDREIIEARYLFGEPVFQKMVEATEKLDNLVRANSKLAEVNDVVLDDSVFDALTRDISSAWKNASRLRHEIADMVEPYMMLDHISVSRPRKLQPRRRKGLFSAGDATGK
ncbi:hypothetical protein [Brevundimonas sp. Marseille-Q4549]